MNIEELYKLIEKVGCMTFSTIGEDNEIHSRIAHFNGYDKEGLYFRTMVTKPYYRQLMKNSKLTVCGISNSNITEYLEDGTPVFPPSFTLRLIGEVKQVPFEIIEKKATKCKELMTAVQDGYKYPTMKDANFVMHKAKVEIFDTDFEMKARKHKLLRTRFSFGEYSFNEPGPNITDKCVACGMCKNVCSFKAIEEGRPYKVISEKCDDCGMCIHVCPVKAIELSKEF